MATFKIPPDHPRYVSLKTRETLIHQWKRGVVADSGLIAHGRGEAFDYLLGERTIPAAERATSAAAATMVLARRPVISVNGNAAALIPREMVLLASASNAALEVNLFYRTRKRETAIARLLRSYGADRILGLGGGTVEIPSLSSNRRIVDQDGIMAADVVLVPLEDGDRAEALAKMGKTVIAIDLNPLSRTSRAATITIVDNITRAFPRLNSEVSRLKHEPRERVRDLVKNYDNKKVLSEALGLIKSRLGTLQNAGDNGFVR